MLSIDSLSFSLLDQLKKVELEMAADDNFNPDRFNEAMSAYKFTVVGRFVSLGSSLSPRMLIVGAR